jgi:hypothetical protein
MLAPASGVLTGVMDRIIGTPATPADLGLKAQVVMWAKRDWWEGDAQRRLVRHAFVTSLHQN